MIDSTGETTCLSSMKSPRWLSSSSPIGRLEADRLLGDLEDLPHLLHRHVHLGRDLLGGRLAPELLDELPGGADELVDRLDHVHRDADGAGLVGDGAGDRLADPPGGVGRELVAAPVLELVDRLHEADVPLLDQVEELEAAVRVLLGDGDDEPEVGLDHLLLGLGGLLLALADDVDDVLQLVDPGLGLLLDALDLPLGVALPALAGRRAAGRRACSGGRSPRRRRGTRKKCSNSTARPLSGSLQSWISCSACFTFGDHLLQPAGQALDHGRVERHLAERGEELLLLEPRMEVELLPLGCRGRCFCCSFWRACISRRSRSTVARPPGRPDERGLLVLVIVLVGDVGDVADRDARTCGARP